VWRKFNLQDIHHLLLPISIERDEQVDIKEKQVLQPHERIIRVLLDPNRYYEDIQGVSDHDEDPNETFNIVLRRSAKVCHITILNLHDHSHIMI
jgi:hypothetical protein